MIDCFICDEPINKEEGGWWVIAFRVYDGEGWAVEVIDPATLPTEKDRVALVHDECLVAHGVNISN